MFVGNCVVNEFGLFVVWFELIGFGQVVIGQGVDVVVEVVVVGVILYLVD